MATDEHVRDARIGIAPARVNLLGEHTDYTGGLVLPMAIPFRTVARVTARERGYRFLSSSFPEERVIDGACPPPVGNWTDYPIGVLRELQAAGYEPEPFVMEVTGDVPLGAGLSSSASVEVAACVAMLKWIGSTMPAEALAVLCQRAENNYVGSPCGIMDQMVIAAAVRDHALLIHTRDLQTELVPLDRGQMARMQIVVVNSEVKHSVAAGEYPKRRQELEAGQALLRSRFGIADLGTGTLADLAAVEAEMPEVSYRRCRHVLSENSRVREARAAMVDGDAARLGALMTASHASERDDFDCSCAEVDFLVEKAMQLPGCYGSRLTGGGFGGCTVSLVEAAHAEDFQRLLRSAYQEAFGIHAQSWICSAVDGALLQSGLSVEGRGSL